MSAGALVGTVYPDGDVTEGWFCTDTTPTCTTTQAATQTHWDRIDDATNNVADFVNTGTSGTTGEIEKYTMTSVAASVLDISSVAVKINANSVACNGNTPNCDTLSVNIWVNGTLQTAQAITLTTTNTEYIMTFTGSWSSDSDLQVQITRNLVGGGNQANADDDVRLTNVKADVTYTAIPNVTQASHRWLSDGAVNLSITNWQTQASAGDNNWTDVTYGNGLFVAVSSDATLNRVMRSSDGRTWSSNGPGNNFLWKSVIYGNGLFVAVGEQHIMTSPDSITWTDRTPAAGSLWHSVAYGNGLFVAVNRDRAGLRVTTSPDGIAWTERATPADLTWENVIFANNQFVAVATTGTGNRVMTSPDGINWTSRNSASDNAWKSSAYGNGLYVAVSSSGTGDRVMTSPDGITWTGRTAPVQSWEGIAFAENTFVAVARSGTGNRVMTSPDGIIWTSQASAANNNWTSVTFGVGLFVSVAQDVGVGNRVMTNGYEANVGTALAAQDTAATAPVDNVRLRMNMGLDNDLPSNSNLNFKIQYAVKGAPACSSSQTYLDLGTATWNLRTSAVDNIWYSVTFGNGLFVAVAESGTGNRVMTSPDGVTWTSRTSAVDNTWKSVTFGNGLFVAVANSGTGNRVMTSPDGITWTARTSATDDGWRSVTFGNGLFVAVANGGTGSRLMTSPDGITWTARTSAAPINTWESVTHGNGLFAAVSYNGTTVNSAMTSPDGITWTARVTPQDTWRSVVYGNGLFVATGATGNGAMSSPDGINWTSRTAANGNDWFSVTFGNGMFIAVTYQGTGDKVMSSPDGINWTIRSSAADNSWYSVTFGNGMFVAVASTGTSNRVMTNRADIYSGGVFDQNKANLVASADDPTQANTIRDQSYRTLNRFTNDKSTLAASEFGRWDFAVNLQLAPRNTAYCFRAVTDNNTSTGSLLATYNFFPQITTAGGAPVNTAPPAPTLIAPAASATGVSTSPTFQLRTTDADGDYLRYRIQLYQSDCTTLVATLDQTVSQTGWTGQDANTNTAYVGSATLTSSTIANHTYQAALSNSTTYCWRAAAADPAGTNTWSANSATSSFTTAAAAGATAPVQINGGVQFRGGTRIGS